MPHDQTPTMIPEWAPQSGVMLTWPHPGTDWFPVLGEVEPVFLAIARAVLRHEDLLISCEHVSRLQSLERELNDYVREQNLPGRVFTVPAPANDTWARDHGPLSVSGPEGIQLLDFRFNAWGGKFPWEKDNALNGHLADSGCFGDTPMRKVDMVVEGGSLECNGAGTLLTTSECLLSSTRNPEMLREDIEQMFAELLGCHQVLWLNHGYLAGDDTDSHIDTLARFCGPEHICYVRCTDPDDEHYPALRAMEQELQQFRTPEGKPWQLTALPWPEACYDDDGERLPATYANFLIINGAVLLPVYDAPQDAEAIKVMGELFPEREIIPIDCQPLIAQHGSLHCITMQLAKGALRS